MQIVIDIPNAMYEKIKLGKDGYSNYVHTAIRNGTPLPKGHGRLIDADVLNSKMIYEINMLNAQACYDSIEESLRIAPTIIEADKEKEND